MSVASEILKDLAIWTICIVAGIAIVAGIIYYVMT